jgi:hypothetical protein
MDISGDLHLDVVSSQCRPELPAYNQSPEDAYGTAAYGMQYENYSTAQFM